MTSSCWLYADDCMLNKKIETQDDVRILKKCLAATKGMEEKVENVSKCSNTKSNPVKSQYTLHSHALASVNSAKYLGIKIDSYLSVNKHNDPTYSYKRQTLH